MKKFKLYTIWVLCLSFAWFTATVFIDFFAVPEVFKQVSSRNEAAALGISIFTKFNYIELVVAMLMILSSFFLAFKEKFKKTLMILCTVLILFPGAYALKLSPEIKKYNRLKVEDPYSEVIQAELDFYHHIYVKADSVKLILLLAVIIYSNVILIRKEDI
ncbi:DUF4149 domain-containing protein [Bacteriovorax sp. Seq25_V]|uniref:DUF4149 domain-containing protein n=1 Tax=Bacteriovorax sp. Seq25_V TaxID=1201288 RepID=UPI00038A283D|nr:DUF4149 domain-containing protein [Bacteriovorax sp. Seq25_V]EQC46182.1 PF13664 domain protein [Bacteriovorax sp. Seq25_V]